MERGVGLCYYPANRMTVVHALLAVRPATVVLEIIACYK